MSDNFIPLDANTYQSMQQELTTLREEVVRLQQAQFKTPFHAARQRTLFNAIGTIRASLNLDTIFEKTTREIRHLFECDRVGVFRFDAASNFTEGEFIAENTDSKYPSILGTQVRDRCFGENYATEYAGGQIQAIADVETAEMSDCHRDILSRFQVRANLVVPLTCWGRLWGLLCVHQCDRPRQWQSEEIDFIQQIAAHLGVALQQAELLRRTKQQARELQRLNRELESAVRDRTAELMATNQALEAQTREREAVDRALNFQEIRLAQIARHLPGAIFQFTSRDDIWQIEYISEGIEALAGISPEEMVADFNRFVQLIHPDDLESYTQSVLEAVERQTPWHYQGRLIRPDGEIRWWQGDSTPTRDERGNMVFCGVLLDISDRKHAETALRQLNEELEARVERRTAELADSERKFRLLFEQSADAILLLDETAIVDCNQAALELLGFRHKSEIVGLPPWEISPTKQRDGTPSRDKARSAIAKALHKRSHRFEWLHCRTDGEVFPAEVVLTAIPFGRRPILHAVLRDISDRYRAETERDRFFNLSADLLCIWGFDGAFKRVNPAFERVLGYSQGELEGTPLLDFVHPDDRRATLDERDRVVSGTVSRRFENRYRCQDGSYRWLAWTAVAFAKDGLVYSVARDVTERKQLEKELALRQARLDAFFDNAPVGLIILDPELRCVQINAALARAHGLPPEEHLGKSIAEVWPGMGEQVAPAFRQVLTSNTPILNREVFGELCDRNRQFCHWTISFFPLPGEGDREVSPQENRPSGVCAVFVEITELKRAEQTLRDSEGRFRALVEATSQIIWTTGPDGKVNQPQPSWCAFTGQNYEDIQEWKWLSAVHPDDSAFTEREWANAIRQKALYQIEHRLRRFDGEYRYMSVRGIPVLNHDGSIREWVGTHTDITERKQAETALKQTTQKLQEAQRLAHIGHWEFNLKSGEIFWSEEVFRIFGLDPSEKVPTLEQHIKQYDRDDRLAFQQTILEALEHGEPYDREFRIVRPDGSLRYINQKGAIECDGEGRLERLYGTVHDITDRKQAELALTQKAQDLKNTLDQLQRAQSQLVQSEKMSGLGQLVAGVAHEINNPVNFIYGNLTHTREYTEDLLELIGLYQQCYPDPVEEICELTDRVDLEFLIEDLPKAIDSMQVGAQRIREIVASLRNFSRLDEAEVKRVEVHGGIESTLTILHNRLKPKGDRPGIEVITNYGDLPEIECYPGQLNQVFMNIIANAIDALEERDRYRNPEQLKTDPSQITICTEYLPSEQSVKITIADNGPGIPEAIQPRILDPFFTTKSIGKGTGLGMSISYQIVTERHGGTLQFMSKIGQGTTFVMTLPISQGTT
ncbi:PAS domain S-box protein [Oxynema aestuarii]|uniref:histidine kinase n=1 Tax=Oxynema aestuarii AP17 TaxID=2064643 RepID=A0A6H1TV24_9CYAN|nr:PAS domain S-box protein [Oxynema aestuarii]QIZ69800.1 PAS domain S-box protein [Oxynema aestuarii AP17]